MDFEIDDLTNLLLNLSAGVHPKNLTEDEVEILKNEYGEDWLNELGYTEEWLRTHPAEDMSLCASSSKPYSDEDYEDAKKQGLDLNDWNDYKKYCRMEEYAENDQDWWRS